MARSLKDILEDLMMSSAFSSIQAAPNFVGTRMPPKSRKSKRKKYRVKTKVVEVPTSYLFTPIDQADTE